ncbi:MAG: FeoA family protein [bacterium]
MTLAEMKPGDRGRVVSMDLAGPLRERLLELGLLPGAEVEVVRRAAFGGPLECRFRSASYALRAEDARRVEIAR